MKLDRRVVWGVVCLLVSVALAGPPQPPMARNGLLDFLYSFDRISGTESPEEGTAGELGVELRSGDIVTQGLRDGLLREVLDRTLHALNSNADELDALSTSATPPRPPRSPDSPARQPRPNNGVRTHGSVESSEGPQPLQLRSLPPGSLAGDIGYSYQRGLQTLYDNRGPNYFWTGSTPRSHGGEFLSFLPEHGSGALVTEMNIPVAVPAGFNDQYGDIVCRIWNFSDPNDICDPVNGLMGSELAGGFQVSVGDPNDPETLLDGGFIYDIGPLDLTVLPGGGIPVSSSELRIQLIYRQRGQPFDHPVLTLGFAQNVSDPNNPTSDCLDPNAVPNPTVGSSGDFYFRDANADGRLTGGIANCNDPSQEPNEVRFFGGCPTWANFYLRIAGQVISGGSGACCLPGGGCVIASPSDCAEQGGQYAGDGTSCDQAGYNIVPCGEALEDIASTGTLALNSSNCDDCSDLNIPIGFNYTFYGNTYSNVRICSNGFISFDQLGPNTFTNVPIPNPAAPNDMLCPFWDDFRTDSLGFGDVYYQTFTSPQRFIVQWNQVRRFGSPSGANTFQVILYADGNAAFRYGAMEGPVLTGTVGVENATGSDGENVADFKVEAGHTCRRVLLSGNLCEENTTFALLFSVDRASVGAVNPEPSLVLAGLPFNVKDQAIKNQEAGDVFLSLLPYTRNGPPPTPFRVANNNTLVFNQGDSGGGDTELEPDLISPEAFVSPPVPLGGIDAGMGSTPPEGMRTTEPFFFSISNTSPSPPLGGQGNGANIYVDQNPLAPGGELIYATAGDLGLSGGMQGDDIDGLIVFDDGDLTFEDGIDQVLFSLKEGSPFLNPSFSGADVFTANGIGSPTIFVAHNRLGLAFNDEVSMIDWVFCDNIDDCALDWGIGYVCSIPGCAGDLDQECDVDLNDLAMLLASFGDFVDGQRSRGDINSSGEVDLADLALLLTSFGQSCH